MGSSLAACCEAPGGVLVDIGEARYARSRDFPSSFGFLSSSANSDFHFDVQVSFSLMEMAFLRFAKCCILIASHSVVTILDFICLFPDSD